MNYTYNYMMTYLSIDKKNYRVISRKDPRNEDA